MQKEDAHIIEKVLGGEVNEFGILLNRYALKVRSFMGRMVANAEDAEELTQNVFLKAYRHLATFDASKSGFGSWLNRIAYHEAIDYLRMKLSMETLSIDDEQADWQAEEDWDVEQPFEDAGSDRVELLQKAVLDLPPQDRMLVHLYYNDELPLRDIAFILDRQPDYLATRLQRIRKKLYKTIQKLEQHETK